MTKKEKELIEVIERINKLVNNLKYNEKDLEVLFEIKAITKITLENIK